MAGGYIVVASISGLSIYTSKGEFVRDQPVKPKYCSVTSVLGMDESSILMLTQISPGRHGMHRVDLTTGNAIWEEIGSISDAVYDGHHYILALKHNAVFDGRGIVASLTSAELVIIKGNTGEYISVTLRMFVSL